MISKGFYFSSKTEKNKGDRDCKFWFHQRRNCGLFVAVLHPHKYRFSQAEKQSSRFHYNNKVLMNFFLCCVDFPELLSCLCYTKRGLPIVFAPKNSHHSLHPKFTLVCLWCRRAGGLSVYGQVWLLGFADGSHSWIQLFTLNRRISCQCYQSPSGHEI